MGAEKKYSHLSSREKAKTIGGEVARVIHLR
jgi:hypothetical protein